MAPLVKIGPDQSKFSVYEYKLSDDTFVLAGKSGLDNDYLSLKHAKSNDWWFHVHGQPGSHVVLCSSSRNQPNKETLKIAASIAAYHSKARDAGVVPVVYTKACNVSKPKGAKPGTVQIRKEAVFKVRPSLPISE